MAVRKWVNEHPRTIISIVTLSILIFLATMASMSLPKLKSKIKTYNYTKRRRAEAEALRKTLSQRQGKPARKGRLVFEKIPMKVKDTLGRTHSIHGKHWASQKWQWNNKTHSGVDSIRNAIKCGDSLDVMWSGGVVLFMKEKGLLEEVIVGGSRSKYFFDDITWDGQNVWVGTRSEGILLLDTSGKIVAKIGSESGLPPADKRLRLCPIEPGRILAAGSFAPHGRGWCAIVEYGNDKKSVNVFHQATKISDKTKTARDPFVVFEPRWIHEYKGKEKDNRIFLVGRAGSRYPLKINLNKMSVSVLSFDGGSGFQLRSSIKMDSRPYFSKNGILFEVNTGGVSCHSAPGTKLPYKNSAHDTICNDFSYGRAVLARYLLEYDGLVYIPGTVWFRFDPNTVEEEKLVDSPLPPPYGYQHDYSFRQTAGEGLIYYWVSAHYGLAGWTEDQDFYQIKVTEDEHILGYFHTFVFEDENGRITDLDKLRLIKGEVTSPDGTVLEYDYGELYNQFHTGGWVVPGTYKLQMFGSYDTPLEFETVEITEDSPEEVVFKIKAQEENVYFGRVVNATTGKPMEGAFVVAGFEGNFSSITHEQWDRMHKLPTNPPVDHWALLPLKDTGRLHSKLQWIVRTDSDGRFEMKFKPSDLPYELLAFEENYLSIILRKEHVDPPQDGRVQLPTMALRPAAIIKIEPVIEIFNSGRPCIQATNVNFWPRFIPQENNYSKQLASHRDKYDYYSPKAAVYYPRLTMNQAQNCYVPAGVSLKMTFNIPFDGRWCIPDIPQTINLKQGETLDLGRYVFDPRMKVFIKLVDSSGNPVGRFPVEHLFGDTGEIIEAHTNEKGMLGVFVIHKCKGRFSIGDKNDGPNLYKELYYEVDGIKDDGKTLTLEVPDEILQHLSDKRLNNFQAY